MLESEGVRRHCFQALARVDAVHPDEKDTIRYDSRTKYGSRLQCRQCSSFHYFGSRRQCRHFSLLLPHCRQKERWDQELCCFNEAEGEMGSRICWNGKKRGRFRRSGAGVERAVKAWGRGMRGEGKFSERRNVSLEQKSHRKVLWAVMRAAMRAIHYILATAGKECKVTRQGETELEKQTRRATYHLRPNTSRSPAASAIRYILATAGAPCVNFCHPQELHHFLLRH